MKSVRKYETEFEKSHAVRFADVRRLDIVSDTILLNFVAASSNTTDGCFNRIWEIDVELNGVLPLLMILAKDTSMANTISVLLLDYASLYSL